MAWSAADIPDQTGRVIVVTGGNSGIGYEACRMFCAAGGSVVIACRNERKGRMAVSGIAADNPRADVSTVALDLADLDSVASCATALHERFDKIDVLVLNAGVMAIPLRRTAQGFEMQLGTNHLGHFALAAQVLDMVTPVPGSRVITVSSGAHKMTGSGGLDFDDLNWEHKRYWAWLAYGQTKLANLLFAHELQRRLEASGAPTISAACHPGYASTNLQWVGPQMNGSRLMAFATAIFSRMFSQPAHDGALPTAFAATAAQVGGGDYIGPDGFGEFWGSPVKVEANALSHDRAAAERLWRVSEELTGVAFAVGAQVNAPGSCT